MLTLASCATVYTPQARDVKRKPKVNGVIALNTTHRDEDRQKADSMMKQTSRRSRNIIRVQSQFMTKAQADGMAFIVTSPLVQILTTDTSVSPYIVDQRTVLVSNASLPKYSDHDKLYQISFDISYTDEIGVQSL